MQRQSPNVAALALQMAMMALHPDQVPPRIRDQDGFEEHPMPRQRGPDPKELAKREALAAQYREEAAARKVLNFRKRLPTGHPNKL